MQIERTSSSKKAPVTHPADFEMEDFDFKPITSGLGFSHQQKATTEVRPAFVDRPVPVKREAPVARPVTAPKKEMNVYQNDLSMFYGQTDQVRSEGATEVTPEKTLRTATKVDRIVAYVLDLSLIGSVLGLVLMFMARSTGMEITDAWELYPDEITPLVVTLFCGFYVLYFSISEKSGATFGKSLLNIRVVDADGKTQNFTTLVLRSFLTLANFLSLGLFAYFDLQNKVTSSRVVKAN